MDAGRVPGAAAKSIGTTTVDSMTMLAPVELVLGDVGELPAATTGYVFPAGATASAETVKSLAAALGVEGDPVAGSPENGMAWKVGPTDGTAPTLTVSASAPTDVVVLGGVGATSGSAGVHADDDDPGDRHASRLGGSVPGADAAGRRADGYRGGATGAPAARRTRRGSRCCAVRHPVRRVVRQRRGRAAPPRRGQLAGTLELRVRTRRSAQVRQRDAASPEPVGPYPLLDVDAAFARSQEQQAGAGWVADMLPLQAVPPPAGTTGTIAPRTAAACA